MSLHYLGKPEAWKVGLFSHALRGCPKNGLFCKLITLKCLKTEKHIDSFQILCRKAYNFNVSAFKYFWLILHKSSPHVRRASAEGT